ASCVNAPCSEGDSAEHDSGSAAEPVSQRAASTCSMAASRECKAASSACSVGRRSSGIVATAAGTLPTRGRSSRPTPEAPGGALMPLLLPIVSHLSRSALGEQARRERILERREPGHAGSDPHEHDRHHLDRKIAAAGRVVEEHQEVDWILLSSGPCVT